MKLQALLLTSLLALGSIPAQAHHNHHRHSEDTIAPALILGAAIIGGAIILDNNHSTHHHHRRHRKPVRVVDSYRSGGRHYTICRQGRRAFYC